MILWREGRRDDVAAAVAMLADDVLGAGRETAALESYLAAFDAMQAEGNNRLIVGETGGETAGETGGEIVAVYQITFISGLSLGAALVADAEARAREAGCSLLQLTSNASRKDALRFYEAQGYTPSHIGFKKPLA